jgi:hypothetical protein
VWRRAPRPSAEQRPVAQIWGAPFLASFARSGQSYHRSVLTPDPSNNPAFDAHAQAPAQTSAPHRRVAQIWGAPFLASSARSGQSYHRSRVPRFSLPLREVGASIPTDLPHRRKLINLHRSLRKPRGNLQLSTHCPRKILRRAHVHIRARAPSSTPPPDSPPRFSQDAPAIPTAEKRGEWAITPAAHPCRHLNKSGRLSAARIEFAHCLKLRA